MTPDPLHSIDPQAEVRRVRASREHEAVPLLLEVESMLQRMSDAAQQVLVRPKAINSESLAALIRINGDLPAILIHIRAARRLLDGKR